MKRRAIAMACAIALLLAAVAEADSHGSKDTAPGCSEWKQPTNADFASIVGKDKACLSSITWGGWDNFFYLFTYEDSRDAYGIPHDIVMLDEHLPLPRRDLLGEEQVLEFLELEGSDRYHPPEQQAGFTKRVDVLKQTYAEMSDIYQKAKAAGRGADVPLK